MSLQLPPRTSAAPRSAPRPPRPSVPTVTKAEVELAVKQIVGMYEPLKDHADALLAFAIESRQSAYSVVQFSWVIAKIELTLGSSEWYYRKWMVQTNEAKKDEKNSSKIPEGRAVKMSRAERDVLIRTIAPIFNAPEGNLEAEKAVASTVIGKFGSAIRTSLKILELVAGEEEYKAFKADLEEARRAEAAAIAAGSTPDAPNSDEDEDGNEDGDTANSQAV